MKGKFYAGKRTGSETDPYRASMEIKKKKTGEQFVFLLDEYLTARQISSHSFSSYLSRLLQKAEI